MAVLEHGKRIAELIVQNQDMMDRLKAAYPSPMPVTFEVPPTLTVTPAYVFKELPKGLSYYYQPHQTQTVKAGERKTVWSFKVPPNHIFHIEYIGTNWYPDTYLLLIVDGNELERIERFYGEVNSPINVKGRYFFAKQEVRFIAVNNSTEDVIYDVYCDGSVYLSEDFFEAAKRGLLV
jgi:hypothetical protein